MRWCAWQQLRAVAESEDTLARLHGDLLGLVIDYVGMKDSRRGLVRASKRYRDAVYAMDAIWTRCDADLATYEQRFLANVPDSISRYARAERYDRPLRAWAAWASRLPASRFLTLRIPDDWPTYLPALRPVLQRAHHLEVQCGCPYDFFYGLGRFKPESLSQMRSLRWRTRDSRFGVRGRVLNDGLPWIKDTLPRLQYLWFEGPPEHLQHWHILARMPALAGARIPLLALSDPMARIERLQADGSVLYVANGPFARRLAHLQHMEFEASNLEQFKVLDLEAAAARSLQYDYTSILRIAPKLRRMYFINGRAWPEAPPKHAGITCVQIRGLSLRGLQGLLAAFPNLQDGYVTLREDAEVDAARELARRRVGLLVCADRKVRSVDARSSYLCVYESQKPLEPETAVAISDAEMWDVARGPEEVEGEEVAPAAPAAPVEVVHEPGDPDNPWSDSDETASDEGDTYPYV